MAATATQGNIGRLKKSKKNLYGSIAESYKDQPPSQGPTYPTYSQHYGGYPSQQTPKKTRPPKPKPLAAPQPYYSPQVSTIVSPSPYPAPAPTQILPLPPYPSPDYYQTPYQGSPAQPATQMPSYPTVPAPYQSSPVQPVVQAPPYPAQAPVSSRPQGPPSPPRTGSLDLLKKTLQTPLTPARGDLLDPKVSTLSHRDPANKPLEYLKDAIFNEDLYGARRLLDKGLDIKSIVGSWEEIVTKRSYWVHDFLWKVGYAELLELGTFEAAHKAIEANRPAILDLLLTKHPRSIDDLETLVKWAIHFGSFRCLDVLLERSYSPKFLQEIFIEAIDRGSYQSIRVILDRKLVNDLQEGLMVSVGKILGKEKVEVQTTVIRTLVYYGVTCQGRKDLYDLLQSNKEQIPIFKKVPFQ